VAPPSRRPLWRRSIVWAHATWARSHMFLAMRRPLPSQCHGTTQERSHTGAKARG
jgi:hypothetical protein